MPNYMTELSPDNNAHVYQIKDKEAAPIDLLKDTVGWVGKNKLSYPYENNNASSGGITFTANNDGSVSVNGTASAGASFFLKYREGQTGVSSNYPLKLPAGQYIVTKGTSASVQLDLFKTVNGSRSDIVSIGKSEGNVEKTFSLDADTQIGVQLLVDNGTQLNNAIVYPMLRKADIVDDTYEPYHPSVESVLEAKGDWDCRNLAVAQDGYVISGNDNNGYTIEKAGTDSLCYIVPVEDGKIYNITKASDVGNRFKIVGFNDYPLSGVDSTARLIYDNPSVNSYSFTNSDNWKYIVFTVNYNASMTYANAKGIVQLASNTNKSYTEHREPLDIAIPSKMSYADNGVLGAKNLQPNTRSSATSNGITFTVNSDGSVTVNGTATANAFFDLDSFDISVGNYRLSQGVESGSDEVRLQLSDTSSGIAFIFSGKSVEFTLNTDKRVHSTVRVGKGQTVNNLTFYPMVTLATDTDSTYVPYAMTNRELTEIKETEVGSLVEGATVSTNAMGNHVEKIGKIVTLHLSLADVTANAWSNIGIIPGDFRPRYMVQTLSMSNQKKVQILTNGIIQSSVALNNDGFEICATWITS